jgi:membrane dipeptidase
MDHIRRFRVLLAMTLLVSAGSCMSTPDLAMLDEARRIHDNVLIVDTHVDISSRFAAEVDPCGPTDQQVDVPKMVEGGMDAAFFIVYVGQGERTPEGHARAHARALDRFAAIRRMTDELCPDAIALAYRADDVAPILESGKRVAVIGLENGYMVGRELSLLSEYYDMGARYLTLSHNGHNDISDSANPRAGEPEAEHGGLSDFGVRVVREMNRLGMMVDVSHISGDAVLDAVRVSRSPVLASHSALQALTPISRNLGDEQLRAIADAGGVVQVVGLAAFVRLPEPEKAAALSALREELGITDWAVWERLTDAERDAYRARVAEIEERWPGGSVADLVDHVDYAVELIGIDHVGISSDFDGGGGVTGWENAAETLNVTLELVRRGYSESEIEKLWGANLMRVWRANEALAEAR